MATLTTPDAVAMNNQKLEEVKQLFQRQLDEGLHPGAGLAVYRYGNLVLDIYGGDAKNAPGPDKRGKNELYDTTLFPQTMKVDWVRIYQQK